MKSPFIGFHFFLQNIKMFRKRVHQHGWILKLAATGILEEWHIPTTTSRDDNHKHVFLLVRNLFSSVAYSSIYSSTFAFGQSRVVQCPLNLPGHSHGNTLRPSFQTTKPSPGCFRSSPPGFLLLLAIAFPVLHAKPKSPLSFSSLSMMN